MHSSPRICILLACVFFASSSVASEDASKKMGDELASTAFRLQQAINACEDFPYSNGQHRVAQIDDDFILTITVAAQDAKGLLMTPLFVLGSMDENGSAVCKEPGCVGWIVTDKNGSVEQPIARNRLSVPGCNAVDLAFVRTNFNKLVTNIPSEMAVEIAKKKMTELRRLLQRPQ